MMGHKEERKAGNLCLEWTELREKCLISAGLSQVVVFFFALVTKTIYKNYQLNIR
jgi:hypothetical protein